jgi:hypothetical protein
MGGVLTVEWHLVCLLCHLPSASSNRYLSANLVFHRMMVLTNMCILIYEVSTIYTGIAVCRVQWCLTRHRIGIMELSHTPPPCNKNVTYRGSWMPLRMPRRRGLLAFSIVSPSPRFLQPNGPNLKASYFYIREKFLQRLQHHWFHHNAENTIKLPT